MDPTRPAHGTSKGAGTVATVIGAIAALWGVWLIFNAVQQETGPFGLLLVPVLLGVGVLASCVGLASLAMGAYLIVYGGKSPAEIEAERRARTRRRRSASR